MESWAKRNRGAVLFIGLFLLLLSPFCCLVPSLFDDDVASPTKSRERIAVGETVYLYAEDRKLMVTMIERVPGQRLALNIALSEVAAGKRLRALAQFVRSKVDGEFEVVSMDFYAGGTSTPLATATFTPELTITQDPEPEAVTSSLPRTTTSWEAPYEVEVTDDIPSVKLSLEVTLPDQLAEAELEQIATELKDQHPGYSTIFIGYHVGEQKETGYWATTHFNPELEINILGASPYIEEGAGVEVPEGATVLGRWLDERPYISGPIVIYEHMGQHHYRQEIQADGSVFDLELNRTRTARGTRFERQGGFSDYFVITDAGTLQMCDDRGCFSEAKSLP